MKINENGICLIVASIAIFLIASVVMLSSWGLFGGGVDDVSNHPTEHNIYPESYMPPLIDIGVGDDWFVVENKTTFHGTIYSATYTKNRQRYVSICIAVCPTVDIAETMYIDFSNDSLRFQNEIVNGLVCDENILVWLQAYNNDVYTKVDWYDMKKCLSNVEDNINSVTPPNGTQ